MKKNIIFTVGIISAALLLSGCTVNPMAKYVIEEKEETGATIVDDTSSQAADTDKASDTGDNAVVDDNKEDAGNTDAGSDDKPQESSTAQKIWRVYKKVDPESSIDSYLYLEIDKSTGSVTMQHQYYSENTYSTVSWPISDQVIQIKEFDPSSGEPWQWEEYMEYSESVIKLHYIDSDGNIIMDSWEEFKFQSEDVLE